jgi:sterol desaturase/sphingolipid hydroxylase (fatty acid hydroxylase superfamily)
MNMSEVITINVAINCWLIFWITYWTVGSFLTYKTHTSGIRKAIHLKEVISVLCINMCWSLFGVIILCLLPIRALTETHIIIKLILTYILTDVLFYHIHIMIHHPHLYGKIHKLHHTFINDSYALVALYCTPYEAIVLNIFSVGLGPIIFQISPPYLYIWFALVGINSVATHSGLTIPYILDGSHDLHHSLTFKNYGITMYLDWIYGTYYCNVEDPKKEEKKEEEKKEEEKKEEEKKEEEKKEEEKKEYKGDFNMKKLPVNMDNFPDLDKFE